MLGFLRKQPVLDEESVDWMFETFEWALQHFDGDVFFNETVLVTPSNEHFPGRADSIHEMAEMIFEQVKGFAGVAHWPTRLMDEEDVQNLEAPKLLLEGAVRGRKGIVQPNVDDAHRLTITYNAFAVNDPEVMIANYAHVFAHYIASLSKQTPPGGQANWPHVTELLAVFMGFGLMMANTAHTNKVRSCGSCAGPIVERTNYLSENDITYALAIFAVIKDIPNSSVNRYLKKSLQPYFKKAVKDVKSRAGIVDKLKKYGAISAA